MSTTKPATLKRQAKAIVAAAKPAIGMRLALGDKALLGSILSGDSWHAWRVLLTAIMGEALTEDERAIFSALTGREHEPRGTLRRILGRHRPEGWQEPRNGRPGGLFGRVP